MPGYLDDLIKDDETKESEASATNSPAISAETPSAKATGDGGDARKSLYGNEFMSRYGR